MQQLFQKKYRISSARLSGFDYSQDAHYFVTICTKDRKNFFGTVRNQQMRLSRIGEIAQKYWQEIPRHFPFVQLDQFVVMPNHFHGIVVIDKWGYGRDAIYRVSTKTKSQYRVSTELNKVSAKLGGATKQYNPMGKNSLGEIIRAYKSAVKRFTTKNKIPFAWQPRYYDHIIRDDKGYNEVQDYILNNPANWNKDQENLETNFADE